MAQVKSMYIADNSNIKLDKTNLSNNHNNRPISLNSNTNNTTETVDLTTYSNKSEDLTEIKLPNNNWIFGQEAIDNQQFGGNQGAFIEDLDYWLSNQKVRDIIYKYYPDATLEEIEALFYNMNEHGCGYIAMINSIMYEYIIHDEMDFYNRFGFPPYKLITGKDGKLTKDYNYEFLFLDFYLWFAKNDPYVDIKKGYCDGCETMQDVLNNMHGIYGYERISNVFQKYLDEKGIKVKIVTDEVYSKEELKELSKKDGKDYGEDLKINKELTKEIIEKYQKMGIDYVIEIAAGETTTLDGIYTSEFDLYYPYDKDGNGKLDDLCTHVDAAGHAMTIVDTTNDPNKVVVSSWGKEYLVDLSQVGNNYCILDYSEFNQNR